jgi:predicted GNAT family acetyltransferase
MQVRRFNNPQEFQNYVQDYLLQHEAEHNLLLGILHSLLHFPERYPERPYLVVCTTDESEGSGETSGEILAVALRTPPNKLVLSKAVDLEAVKLIAQDLQNAAEALPGVSGLVAEVETFLQAWQTLTHQPFHRMMEMRIYQLTQVNAVPGVRGHLRQATAADRPLLVDWFTAFGSEIKGVMREPPEKLADIGLKRQSIHLWEDGVPVSWASGSQSLPTAARIGPVYTPPAYRRKGYATACVAALSQKFLDQGCDRCFLFTDLANPTSNHIYQQIGYYPICDWHDYSFTAAQD